ncbi:MAG TPA: type II toxin-antitoxin system prevent-host-death family antitoxin [Intrasporangiaceae bacterium]|nr:type II toxin-antitoxin system prevent-host-death family antitoxin [Intrasporangiaceae bacterium]
METVKVQHAKTHLSAILARVEAGEEFLIARGETVVAHLVPVRPRRRELGFGAYRLPDTFFEELPEAELEQWDQHG